MILGSVHGSVGTTVLADRKSSFFLIIYSFWKKNITLNIKLKLLQSPSSFFILISINITHCIKLFRKSEKVFVFQNCDKILNDIFW